MPTMNADNLITALEHFLPPRPDPDARPDPNELPKHDPHRPPIALVLGSGFSAPLIPTTRQIVDHDLPWWLRCNDRNEPNLTRADFADENAQKDQQDATADYARAFWKDALATAPESAFTLDQETGLPTPETRGNAYRHALSPHCIRGLNTPDRVRRYFAALVKRVDNRLNAAHLYLAALLAERPGFIRTIFTTNFDPLLQRALQLFNVPYFVSNTPDTLQRPDDHDPTDALHLVYAHGSIYRYLLANDEPTIEEFASRNRSDFKAYFESHPVLILGYSGWDSDAITSALKEASTFRHNLYWGDLADTLQSSSLSPTARNIISHHNNASYVPTGSADNFMVRLYHRITGNSLPDYFREPIKSVLTDLNRCDLKGITRFARIPRCSVYGYSIRRALLCLGTRLQRLRCLFL